MGGMMASETPAPRFPHPAVVAAARPTCRRAAGPHMGANAPAVQRAARGGAPPSPIQQEGGGGGVSSGLLWGNGKDRTAAAVARSAASFPMIYPRFLTHKYRSKVAEEKKSVKLRGKSGWLTRFPLTRLGGRSSLTGTRVLTPLLCPSLCLPVSLSPSP